MSEIRFFKPDDFRLVIPRERELTAAALCNRLLAEKGTRVYSYACKSEGVFEWSVTQFAQATHQALLIAVEPIKRDTPEGLLRLLVEHHDAPAERESLGQYGRLIDRARRVLEGGAK